MTRHLARWSLVTGTFLFIGAAALAGTGNPFPGQTTGAAPSISDTTQPVPWQRGARFRIACGEDLHRLCYGIQPGEGRLIQCLLSHRVQLSPACTSRLAAARPAPGVASPSYPIRKVQACHPLAPLRREAAPYEPLAVRMCKGFAMEPPSETAASSTA